MKSRRWVKCCWQWAVRRVDRDESLRYFADVEIQAHAWNKRDLQLRETNTVRP